MSWHCLLLAVPLLACGCGSGAVRQLSKAELDYMAAVSKRVDDHQADVEQLVLDLRTTERQYAQEERQKTLTAVAQARLLESMKAPWAAPPESLQATQRAVVLFHLYELLGQERAAFEAEQSERDAQRQQIVDKHKKLATLLHSVITNEKVVLEYLNQPKTSQITAIVVETLKESRAVGEELGKSTDPRLQALAANTQKAADRVEKVKDALQDVLDNLNKLNK